MTTIGVIGGTGLYDLPGLEDVAQHAVITPFGAPSSLITDGRLGEARLLFIARHGAGHTLLPSEINYRANIYALKELGAEWCIGVSAVGSLVEDYRPGDLAVPDQIIDRTVRRIGTFFGEGICAHVPFATPFCPLLRRVLLDSAAAAAPKKRVHDGGTYVCMEGPAFSTRAESNLHRSWGASLIGMTLLPEAKLAREAEISYATLALVTDYDCWRSESSDIDIPELLATLAANAASARAVVADAAAKLVDKTRPKLVSSALETAILTDRQKIDPRAKERLRAIIGRYLD